jgi:hypothetical protein
MRAARHRHVLDVGQLAPGPFGGGADYCISLFSLSMPNRRKVWSECIALPAPLGVSAPKKVQEGPVADFVFC